MLRDQMPRAKGGLQARRAKLDHVAAASNTLARIVVDYQRWERQQRRMA